MDSNKTESCKGEIILYQPNESLKLEVQIENDTVWLTQQQMAELFLTTKQNVSLHINNIFKEFYTSKSRSHNNWGLGLYYTYKVVKKHMGYISVESKPGIKTMFQIILPRWDKNAKIRKGMSVYGKN